MTDFLTNLAARTIAQPSLLPRTRGRFEPATVEAAPLVWPEATPAVTATAAKTEDVPERGEKSARVSTDTKAVAAAIAPKTVAEEPQRETAPAQVATPEEPPRRTLPPRPVPVVQQREQRREAATPAPMPHVEAPHEVERETVIEVVTQTQPAPPAPPARTIIARTATPEPQTPHRHDELPPRIEPVQAPTPPPQLIEQTTRTTTVHTRRAPSTKTPESPTPNAQSPVIEKQEPTIHVSIGRIEVRAVTPPAAPKRESTRAPMSIDEYVARRDGKGGGQ